MALGAQRGWRVLRQGMPLMRRFNTKLTVQARGQTDDIRRSVDMSDDAPLLQDIEQHQQGPDQAEPSLLTMNIGFVAGVIPRERIAAFERILWRTLRGNLYMNQFEIEEPIIDPETSEGTAKNVFVVFAHGKEIIAKIRKISESLGAISTV